jgi:hypothetical protein
MRLKDERSYSYPYLASESKKTKVIQDLLVLENVIKQYFLNVLDMDFK